MIEKYPLPEGWRWVRLGEVCDSAETRASTLTPSLPFRYVDISSVDASCKKIVEACTILGKDAPSRARQIIKANDVLVATTRPNLNAVAFVTKELHNEICSTGFCVLRPTGLVEPLFLFIFVQTQLFVEIVSGQVRGMLYPAVTDNQVRGVPMPLPPLSEQRRLATKIQDFMQEVGRARRACEKQLEAAQALPAAYLREVFEGEEAEKWERKRLGEVCTINPSRPKNFPRSPNAPTTFVPMAAVDEKTGTIYTPLVVPYSKVSKGYTYFEENDVLFAKITPCMQNGKHVIARDLIDGIGFGTTEFHVLRSNGMVLPEWIHCFIRQPYFLQEATVYFTGAVGQQRIPEDFLINYVILLPPLPEQKRIATKLQELMQEVERARTAYERQIEAINALPQMILSKVFRGEL